MSDNRGMQYAEILSKLIKVETISSRGNKDITKFLEFHKVLRETFPSFFNTVECEEFNGSLLLKWKGEDSSLKPIMLMNHHDVVEASGDWTHPAFSGEIADGRVWGRGTLDTKGGLAMMLQAAEELIKEGFTPKRDVYFVSSCNEETDGAGCDAVSLALKERNIELQFVLDEGGMIKYDPIGGAKGTFAMIGVGEKCCIDLKFIAKSKGGHASAPDKNTPLVRLSKFMIEAEKAECFEVKMSDTVKETLSRFAPTMSGVMKLACGNVNAFEPVLKKAMPIISPSGAALLRTTLAFTMSNGSDGSNVIPQEAWVIGNMRASHHQGKKASIDAISALAKKYDIETVITDDGIESGLADYRGEAFKFIEKAVVSVFPDYKPVPYVMNAATDSRYFDRVCKNCLRFVPFLIDDQQLDSIHAIDENVNISTLAPAVDFYKYVIKEA
ncbi:MAG: M20/M25/M40 family metallo-hydrolase [Clostridia bacterium]|nr:M20/M25/M40 family metallo-hydrolase [Clostridia bacterium]